MYQKTCRNHFYRYVFMLTLLLCVESVSVVSATRRGETVSQQENDLEMWGCGFCDLSSQQLYHSVIYFNITQIFRTVLFQSGQQHSSSFSLKFSASLILLLLRLFLSPALTELVVWIRVSSSTSPPISAISSRTCWFNSSSSHPERRLHNSANSTPAPPD